MNQMRIERRNHEPGAGDGDDEVDFLRRHSGAFETLFRRFAPQLDGVFDIFVIRFRERSRFNGVVNRKDGVPRLHLRVVHNRHHRFEPALRDVEHAAHVIFHVIARDFVRRQRGGGGHDMRVLGIRGPVI